MPDMNYAKLLGRIKEYGLTQKELAHRAGISEGQLNQKLKGVYPFKQSDIQRLCEILDISAELIGAYFFSAES